MSHKVLVSGCSYTENFSWPRVLFDHSEIVNLGRGGAGNYYIGQSVIDWVSRNPTDFVFILWSGLRRIDLPLPSSLKDTEFAEFLHSGVTTHTFWACSGGSQNLVPESDQQIWNHTDVDRFFKLQYGANDQEYLVYHSTLNVMNCQNFLKQQNIDYRFSFIYNVFSPPIESASLGPRVTKDTHFFKFVDWNKYIDLTPFEFGIRQDLLDHTQCHLTAQGMDVWAGNIKHLIQSKENT